MTRFAIPHCVEPVWPEGISRARFGSRVTPAPGGAAVALLGMPDDTGVRMNGGRPGASEGPTALRAALARLGAADPPGFDWPGVFDAGDVQPGGDIDETHARVLEAAKAIHELGLVPVGIGGGHDLTFPFARAAAESHGPLIGVYCDPHLDVRAEKGSGMPFRALIEGGFATSLHIHGYEPLANSAEHKRWFDSHNGHVDAFGPREGWPDGPVFVSFDLDVIDQAYAPGVSAMNPVGWSPREGEAWARAAGEREQVRCFDVMELCPKHDEGGRTARLAARLVLAFLRGFVERRS